MHNWWIAALEHAGIWTREQAEHVSNEIKNSLHRERYTEAYEELGNILSKGKFEGLPILTRLEADIEDLKSKPAADTSVKKVLAKPN